MAGAGYKLFQTGDVLTAAQVNTYLNEQTVMVFANAAARTSALTSVLAEGMVSYLQDTNNIEVYNGSAWVGFTGDITEVQAGTGISVASGTGPIPVITNTVATTFDAAGDLVYGTGADTFTKLSLGTAGKVLTVNSGATAPEWATPAAGGMTLLSTTSLTGASTTISAISGDYTDLKVVIYGWQGDTTNVRNYLRLNGISTSTYRVVYSSSYQTANYQFSPTSAILTNAVSTASAINTMVVLIPNYASTAITKVAQFYGFNYDNNTPAFESYNGVASTEISGAITSLVFSRASGNLTAGTVLVYGVK